MNKKLVRTVGRYIKNTPKKGYVKGLRIKICEVPHKLRSCLKAKDSRAYITTKSLKHLYDVRSAQEFDFIISKLENVLTHPHKVYKNKPGKTGDYCLYCEFEADAYFYILEVDPTNIYVISAYRLSEINQKRENYLEGYKLLRSWKVDLPSS